MLGDVADPGALVQPLDEAAAPAAAAGVVGQTGQPLDQPIGEAGQQVGGEVLQHPEVDHELDRRLVVPDVRAPVDPAGDDPQVGRRGRRGALHRLRLLRREGASDLCTPRGFRATGPWWPTAPTARAAGPDGRSGTAIRPRPRSPRPASAGWPRPPAPRPPRGREPASGGRASVRSTRSNWLPAGSTCSTAPETSSGAVRWAAYALATRCCPSTTVTAPRPTTSSRAPSTITAAVSSSIPTPSRAGDWATRESSRPYRLRCSKCWSTIAPRSSPRPADSWLIRCRGRRPTLNRRRSCARPGCWPRPRCRRRRSRARTRL